MSDASPVVILGAGRHTAVLLETLLSLGRRVLGVAGPSAEGIDPALAYLGTDDDLISSDPDSFELVCGVGSVRSPDLRTSLFLRFQEAGFAFTSVVHPSAVIADSVHLGAGAQVMAGAIITSGARIGRGVLINTGAIVDHDCVIGDYSHIATGARLAGEVRVGSSCHVGAGATVIQRVSMGNGCVVGAGAVVIGDVSPGRTVVGVPARPLGSRA